MARRGVDGKFRKAPPTQESLVYDKALRGLPALSAAEAWELIAEMSPRKQQIFLTAEEDGSHRAAVLNRFPPVPAKLKETLHAC